MIQIDILYNWLKVRLSLRCYFTSTRRTAKHWGAKFRGSHLTPYWK